MATALIFGLFGNFNYENTTIDFTKHSSLSLEKDHINCPILKRLSYKVELFKQRLLDDLKLSELLADLVGIKFGAITQNRQLKEAFLESALYASCISSLTELPCFHNSSKCVTWADI